jgi:hypothetical protein
MSIFQVDGGASVLLTPFWHISGPATAEHCELQTAEFCFTFSLKDLGLVIFFIFFYFFMNK